MHAETDPLKIYETFRKDELDKADAVRKHGLRMELREIIEYIAEQPDGDWLGADDARLVLALMDERDAALDAEGVGLPWKPAPPMRERGSMPPVVLWRSPEGHQFQVAPSEFGALWASHYCELSALAPPKPTDAEIAALRARVEALEAALREIEDWAPNWAQSVDENVDAIRDYARALLEGDDATRDFARTLLEQKP